MASQNSMRSACWSDTISKSGLAQLAGMVDGGGTVYYVDGLHPNASDSNAGTDRNRPLSTLTAAVTASEADRAARASLYTRNTIYLVSNGGYSQGTVDPYAITALPNFTNIIGIGASPSGAGPGIATIAGTTATIGSGSGLYFENLMFEAPVSANPGTSATYWCLFTTQILRSKFINCAFMGSNFTSVGYGALGGLNVTAALGGCDILGCTFGSNSAALVTGIQVGAGFNGNRIEGNNIAALTNGIYSNTQSDQGTLIKNNVIASSLQSDAEMTYGIRCATQASQRIVGNYIAAADCILRPGGTGTRFEWDNHCLSGGTGSIETASS